jgi:hypothetical protein
MRKYMESSNAKSREGRVFCPLGKVRMTENPFVDAK